MSLDPGIAAVGVGVCGTVIAAIIKFAPNKGNGTGAGYVSKELFDERTTAIAQSLNRIEKKLNAHCAHERET